MPMMWDRLKTPQRQVGGGPLADDERIRLSTGYSHAKNASATRKGGYSYSIKGGPAPPRPPREFLESHHEVVVAPAVQEPRPPPRNPNRITLRASNVRPASSVYSQDTTPPPTKTSGFTVTVATKYGYRYGGVEEISPPSSPEPDVEGAARFFPGDVSPIEEEDQPHAPQQHPALRNAAPPATGNGDQESNQAAPRETGRESPRGSANNHNHSNNNSNSRGGAANIPMLRRERRKQSDAAVREANSHQRGGMASQHHRSPPSRDNTQDAPRWDPLTGERTTSDRGRPSQAKPAEFAQGLGISTHAWASPVNSPTHAPPSFSDRVRRIAKKATAGRDREKEIDTDPAAGAFTSTRPGWRGASGRTAIVDPVRDTPEVAPLRIPEKSSRRTFAPAQAPEHRPEITLGGALRRGQTPPISPPAVETPTAGARSGPRDMPRHNVQIAAQQTPHAQFRPEHGQSYPSPPLTGTPLGGDAPAVAARELARDGYPTAAALPSPIFNANSTDTNAIRRKPPPLQTNHQHQASVSSVYSQPSQAAQPPPLHIPEFAPPAPAAATDAWVQPPSRFSVTTYATSNTGTTREEGDDLIDEDQPPVPSIPAGLQNPTTASLSSDHSPVTSPIDQFMTSPFTLHSEPLTMSTATNPAIARAQAIERIERPDSRASDMNKSLPPAPPETSAGEAQDRVGMLDARMRALANRRININRSIAQMTEMMPTDKLMNSEEVVRKRESEKKKVEALKQELADVQREEYDLGMKLHRAYKRLDRDADLTTTLWVRRVTT